ncbi:MAG: alpha/beta hydrolase [Raineya sp.]|jgi:alpha-beta hydrolase superfamily lysophospholipase|nr:alpha/beta hydrolase [Raineya sp.]
MYSENSQEPLFKQELQIVSTHHHKSIGMDIRLVLDDETKPLVIFVHGFKGFKDWGHFNLIADEFARNGFIFAKINLSHNGTSPTDKRNFVDLEAFGHQTFTKDLHDIEDAINYFFSGDYLFKANTNLQELYLIGHSRGGGLVILKALEDNRVKKVATWASISDSKFLFNQERIEEIEKDGVIYIENARTKQQMPIYREVYEDLLKHSQKFDLEHRIPQLQVPLLLIHGKNDTSVLPKSSENLKDWSKNSTLILLEDADHTFGGKEPYTDELLPVHTDELVDETIAFFKG